MLLPEENVGESFKREDFSRRTIEGTHFSECTFVDCDFTETALLDCQFTDCTFSGCDWSLVKLRDCVFVRTAFKDCKVVGVNWMDAAFNRRYLSAVSFEGCVLNYCTFIGLQLPKTVMRRCRALDVDFAECDLSDGDFRGTDFADSRFNNTDLSWADFRDARNYVISPEFNRVKGAKFKLPEAISLLRQLDITLIEDGDDDDDD